MTVVDSTVWIDFFRGSTTCETTALRSRKGLGVILVGNLVLAEVLQGFPDERQAEAGRQTLERFAVEPMAGRDVAVAAAGNYRRLRSPGYHDPPHHRPPNRQLLHRTRPRPAPPRPRFRPDGRSLGAAGRMTDALTTDIHPSTPLPRPRRRPHRQRSQGHQLRRLSSTQVKPSCAVRLSRAPL